MALLAVLTTVSGRVKDLTPSVSRPAPVQETSAGYLKPPVLLTTVPSVLARHEAEARATELTGTPAPDTPAPQTTPDATVAAAPQPAYFTYTVQPGDTVYSIAEQFGISSDYIIWSNPPVALDPNLLIVGATIVIPSTNGIVYNVVVGDTLNDIASYYQIDAGSVISFGPNGLATPDSLVEGMVLVLPGAVPPPAPVAVVATIDEEPLPEPAAVYEEPAADDPLPPAAPPVASTGYIWPFYGAISTYFGGGHGGIDIDGFGAYGAPIAAAASGTVILTAWDSWGYGYHVIIQHDDGSQTLYGHLSDIWVSQGQYVGQGEAIGALGSTGYSTGPHLHFEIHIGGQVDPLAYLP